METTYYKLLIKMVFGSFIGMVCQLLFVDGCLARKANAPTGQSKAGMEAKYPAVSLAEVSTLEIQAIQVTGTVRSLADDAPLPGVNVIVKGTNIGTVTDSDGKYSISVPDENDTLVFSSIGYTREELPVSGRSAIDVVLSEDIRSLSEVVVVGYGTQEKRDLTGAVSSVDAKAISEVVANNAVQAIQGRVSGVNISQDSWRPGAGATVRIRGTRSITASNDPLYVIDGNPIARGNITINDINPSDIESIEVLKDASATAIYGSRGANGVILITTKRGKSGKTTVSYDAYEGFQEPLRTVDVWNGGEYAEYVRDSYRNNDSPTYNSPVPSMEEDKALGQFAQDPYVLASVLMGYDENGNYDPARVRSFDWMDAVMQTGRIQNHQLSVSGGSEKTKVLLSGGYFANKGLVKNMDYKRYNIRVNLDHQLTERIKLSTSSVISRAHEDIGSNLYALARQVNPLASPYDANGDMVLNPGNDPLTLNPLLDIDGIINDSRKDRILTNFNVEAEIIEGLRYRANFGYDYRTARDGSFQTSRSTARSGRTPWASYGGNASTDIILENLLFYDKTFSDQHKLGVTLLQSVQTNKFEEYATTVEGLPYESQKFYNVGSASEILGVNSNLTEWQMLSWMARINYNLFDKYLFTITGRRDGSSVLAEGRKYAFFPSAAFAWRVADESFLQGASFLSDLKLRMSYGKTGNSAINPYQTQGNLAITRYVWDESVIIGYAPGDMPNPLLSWETTAQADLGLDFGFFKNRIAGTIDLYRSNTEGLLMPRRLPIVSGFAEVLTNVGKTRNTGLEINVSTVNFDTNHGFRWNTNFVFSRNKEEIVELSDGKVDDIGNEWFIGYPVDVFFDQHVIGIWQDTEADRAAMEQLNANGHNFEPGLVRLADYNQDGKITTDDRIILGSPRPQWTAGFTNNFYFKPFDLAFQWYASYGAMGIFDKNLALNGRYNMVDIDYWTPENPSNRYPKPSAGWLAPDYIFESYYQDVSFLRLKFVTLGYTIPEAVRNKLSMSRLRVYVSAQNPYLYTQFDGLDPEGAQGFDAPSPRTFMVGINASF